MAWTLSIGGIHLTNSSGTPTAGGDPAAAATSCFAVGRDFMFKPGVEQEEIPFAVVGSSQSNAASRLRQLKRALKTATFSVPAPLAWQPEGASEAIYTEVYGGDVEELPGEGIETVAGGYDIEGVVRLTKAPYFGAGSLGLLINAATFTNTHTGNVVSLGALSGDEDYTGQPLNIRFDKPAAQSPTVLYLSTVYSRTPDTTSSTQTAITDQTVGANFTVSGNIDLSALRTRAGLKLRILARLTTLTNPSVAQIKPTVSASGGGTLWSPPNWTTLGSNTTAQLVDSGGIDLSQLRYALSNTSNVTIQIALRSATGAAVTATLGYVEALLYYDFCKVESGIALGASQRYQLLGAQNLSGGGWLPQVPETAMIVSTSDAPIRPVTLRQPLVRAFDGASLYAAWIDANGAHTNTDTTTIKVELAPLFRTLRG